MAEIDAAYSFTIPSIEDDTPLDCRIYHPKCLNDGLYNEERLKSVNCAVLAHPYAPLGGCYDDPVVLYTTETLLGHGFIVGTFNFRGAADAAGSTSWTGKAEQGDYVSFVGFLLSYIRSLVSTSNDDNCIRHSSDESGSKSAEPHAGEEGIDMLLGGYSYGSLVLARLPPLSTIVQLFDRPEIGTTASEIILRAKSLAAETRLDQKSPSTATSPRGRQLKPDHAALSPNRRAGASPLLLGGEETDPTMRRRSRDSRRSTDIIRKSIDKVHNKRRSTDKRPRSRRRDVSSRSSDEGQGAPAVSVRYLIISPVILPFTTSLCPPGPPSIGLSLMKQANPSSGLTFLQHPALAIFGSKDVFTSSKRLRNWAEKQSRDSRAGFEWEAIECAGHFWHEEGAMQALQDRVSKWAHAKAS